MKHFFISLTLLLCFLMPAMAQSDVQVTEDTRASWVASARQVIDYLLDKHANHNRIYDARDFGLPAPDTLRLKTSDGLNIFAYEVCPQKPKGVVICLSGIENPSVTAYYGHAAEFLKADVATIMPDLRGHGKSDGNRLCLGYEETLDVKAVTDYVKECDKYHGVPVIVMGVSMGGSVAIRSISENKDIDALISLSAFSSLEDFMRVYHEALLPMIPASELDGVVAAVVKDKFGVDSRTSSPIYAVRGLNNRPVLLMHSRQDSQVPFACYGRLLSEMQKYTNDIDTLVVEGDEHFITPDFTAPDKEYMRRIMRFVRKLTVKHPYVRTEEFVELMELVARFADNTVFNDSIAPRYQKDCDQWCGELRNHPAVQWLAGQLPVYGIGYDAVPWMGAHLRWTDNGFVTIPNANKEYKRWPKKAIREFLPLLSDFYRKSRFSEFYRQHEDMYKTAVDAARMTMADYIDLDWFGKFFNTELTCDFGIIVGLNNGGGSFSIDRTKPGQRPEKIAVMLYGERKDGTPCYYRDSEEDKILVHEYCHSFIQPSAKYRKAGMRLLNEHRKKMNSMGYGTWKNIVEESLVRVSVIRYLIDHGYSDEDIRKEIEIEHKYYGFVWLPTDIEWYKGNPLSLFED